MKKKYEKPTLEVTEFRFAENIASSGGTCCYWGAVDTYSHGFVGCNEKFEKKNGWVNSNI